MASTTLSSLVQVPSTLMRNQQTNKITRAKNRMNKTKRKGWKTRVTRTTKYINLKKWIKKATARAGQVMEMLILEIRRLQGTEACSRWTILWKTNTKWLLLFYSLKWQSLFICNGASALLSLCAKKLGANLSKLRFKWLIGYTFWTECVLNVTNTWSILWTLFKNMVEIITT